MAQWNESKVLFVRGNIANVISAVVAILERIENKLKKTKKNDTENIEWLLILDKDFAQCYSSPYKKKPDKSWRNENIQYYMSFCVVFTQENLTNKLLQNERRKSEHIFWLVWHRRVKERTRVNFELAHGITIIC